MVEGAGSDAESGVRTEPSLESASCLSISSMACRTPRGLLDSAGQPRAADRDAALDAVRAPGRALE